MAPSEPHATAIDIAADQRHHVESMLMRESLLDK